MISIEANSIRDSTKKKRAINPQYNYQLRNDRGLFAFLSYPGSAIRMTIVAMPSLKLADLRIRKTSAMQIVRTTSRASMFF